jgi:hypothetical protein
MSSSSGNIRVSNASIRNRALFVRMGRESSDWSHVGLVSKLASLCCAISKVAQDLVYAFLQRNTKLFDPDYYIASNPAIGLWRSAPWLHFVLFGAKRRRRPHPLFDAAFYLQQYPDVAARNRNPLFHYLRHGAREGRRPHVLFQPDHYLRLCPEAALHEEGPLVHFLESRGEHSGNPHPLFDCGNYVRWHPHAGDANPLLHYLQHSSMGKSEQGGSTGATQTEPEGRTVLLHYHFFKNAGTTLEEILSRNFRENYRRLDTADRNGILTNDDLLSFLAANPEARAVSSHQLRHPVPEAPGFTFLDVCFLRDPLDRIRSTYDYFRGEPDPADPLSDLANNFSMEEYLVRLIEHYPHHVKNTQVRLLANRGVRDGPPGDRDLDQAIATMRKISFLGVVDCFNESMIAGVDIIGSSFPRFDYIHRPANITHGMTGTLPERLKALRRICGSRLHEELVRLNALDRELVRHARAEVIGRFKMVANYPVRFQLLDTCVKAHMNTTLHRITFTA